jgi:hypothetical protein
VLLKPDEEFTPEDVEQLLEMIREAGAGTGAVV